MALFDKPKLLFKTARVPDLESYVGRKVTIPDDFVPGSGLTVKIKKIVGNRFKTQFYEINDKYLIGMLRFHAQMVGDKSITEEQFQKFEQMEVSAEKLPEEDGLSKNILNLGPDKV